MGTVPAPNIVESAAMISQNPLTEYARSVSLQGQQEQLHQQQMQSEQMQQQLADQKALTASMRDPGFKSLDDLPDLVKKHGGSFNAYQDTLQKVLARKQSLQSLDTGALANMEKHHDYAISQIDAAAKVPDDQLAQHISDTIDVSQQQGHLSPQEAANVKQHAQSMPPAEFRPWLDVYKKSLMAESAIIAQTKTQGEIDKNKAEKDRADAEAGKAREGEWHAVQELGLEVNSKSGETRPIGGVGAVMSPAMIESKYIALAQKKAAKQTLSTEDTSFMKGVEDYKKIVPVANFNLQNSGAAADNNGNPSAIAHAIAENRMKWSEAVSPRTPQATKNAIMAQVFKLNPQYDTSEFGLETDAAKKARSGAWADTRLAYNTAIDHSKQLLDAIDALNSGDVKKLNSMKNFFKTEFGSPDVPTFSAIANAYNHEVTSVVSKGHITDAEVATGHATLPDNASPQALRGVVNAYTGLMTSKRDELDKIIKAGAGNKANSVMNVKAGGENAGSAKVLSLAQIRKAAKDHNVSTDEAIRQAKAAGYTIQ